MCIRRLVSIALGAGVSLALVLLLAGESRAQGFLPQSPDSMLQAAIDSLPGAPIVLTQALELAVQNDPLVTEAHAGVLAAKGTVRKEKGTFDPELFANLLRSGTDQPTASPF